MNTSRALAPITIALLCGLYGCQTTDMRGGDPTEAEIRRAMDRAVQSAPTSPAAPPPEVTAALLPPLTAGGASTAAIEPRFDLSVSDAPAREFFMSLVEGTPLNMVVHPNVGGEITLNLRNVTVSEVMEAVREVYGYEYQRAGSGYHVLPMRLKSRVFQVNHLNIKRGGTSQTRVHGGEVSQVAGASGGSGSSSSGATSSGGGSTTSSTLPSSEIETESASDYWEELKGALSAIVGSGEGRSVVISPQAGVVVVRAMPQELREVEAFLDASQDNLGRQVILEAKIIEVELTDQFRTGINWAQTGFFEHGKRAIFGQTGGGTLLDGRLLGGVNGGAASDIAGNAGNLNPIAPLPVDGTATSAFGGMFTAAIDLDNFTAFIELLKTQGDVQVLSSPRVSTLNNQKAVIKVGSDEFFVTDISSTTTTATATSTDLDVTLTPFFSGIALDVTPQVSTEGEVTLHIHPTISEVQDQTKTIDLGNEGGTLTLPLAFSTVRETDTMIRAQSGQVVVIGGLMQDIARKARAMLPGLGEIPFLGEAFKHRNDASAKSELVILLRPVVVDRAETWSDTLREHAGRVETMQQGLQKSGAR